MNIKDKFISIGKKLYLAISFIVGIGAGKLVYDFLHKQDQSKLKSIGIGILAILAGLFVSGVLLTPTRRWYLPKCPECKYGKLHKNEEILETFHRKGGFHYYGIVLPDIEVQKIRETIFCDKCNYKTVREYER